ncbi:MAG: FHA domain-containing protein [Gammaproteobacteria bacterium]|nr:FHA domain-containing protein [Gammaproteobacteria bacterium]
MNNNANVEIDIMEGRTYIVGREGHIYINDASVSRQHAEIKIIDGKIRLRDLDSTNGTYLVKGGGLVQFKEVFLKPQHTVAIGKKVYTVQNLLALIDVFAAFSDKTGLALRLRE